MSSPEPEPPSDFELPSEDEEDEEDEPEPLSDFALPSEDEEVEDEEPWEDESFPEPSLPLPQAVSERVAARLMAARAVMRVYFTGFPQERARCMWTDVFLSRAGLQAVLRDVLVLSQAY